MRWGEWGSPRAVRVGRALVLGIVASLAVTAISRLEGVWGWEKQAVAFFLFWRDRVPAPEIVVVAIDDEAFREMGERQPLSRRYLADLGEFLLQSGARVVAFDVVFETPTDPSEDEAFVAMSQRWEKEGTGSLVFSARAVARKGETPERYDLGPAFSPDLTGFFGFPNARRDAHGVIRLMAPVLPSGQGGWLPAFAVAVLAAYSKQAPGDMMRALEGQGGGVIALPARGPEGNVRDEPIALTGLAGRSLRVDFAGPPGTFTSFPSGALLGLARSGTRPDPDNPFQGKIVLVGATFLESRDSYPTPVGLMAGVEIQANMVQTLLGRRLGQPPHWALNLAVLIGTCLAVSLLSLWLRPLWVAALSIGLAAAFAAVSYEAYVRAGYWLDFVAPLVGMLAYLQGSRFLARRRLRSAFGQFVSPQVMDRVLREGAALGGELRTVSILMSDLRGFTTMSEKLPPERISEIMNEYFTAMVEVILAHKGMINDFIGDGILAVYGAPADDPDHAWHAVATALEMQAALQRLNELWQAEARAPLGMGVAVNTGEVFAGNLGSPRRKKYTVLGDTVNTVARIEGLNRDLSTAILISGATLAVVRDRVVVRDRGAVPVKGRGQPVEVFELLDIRETAAAPPGRRT